MPGLLLLERDSGVIEPHLSRHGLFEDVFQSVCGLVCAVPRGRAAINLSRAVLVEALSEFRTNSWVDCRERRKRYALSLIVEDVESADVVHVGAILRFGLYIHLPLTAKTIEVVDEITAHEGLNSAIDVSQIDALLQQCRATARL